MLRRIDAPESKRQDCTLHFRPERIAIHDGDCWPVEDTLVPRLRWMLTIVCGLFLCALRSSLMTMALIRARVLVTSIVVHTARVRDGKTGQATNQDAERNAREHGRVVSTPERRHDERYIQVKRHTVVDDGLCE